MNTFLHSNLRLLLYCIAHVILYMGYCIFMPMSVHSQSLADIRGLSLGRTGVASARGADALVVNPANIAITYSVTANNMIFGRSDTTSAFSIVLAGVGALGGLDAMSMNDFTYYFGGDGRNPDGTIRQRRLSTDERNRLLTLIDNAPFYAHADIHAFGLTFGLGNAGVLGFSANSTTQVSGQLPRNLTAIARDYTGESALMIDHASFSLYSAVNAQLSYALHVLPLTSTGVVRALAAGASFKYIVGLGYAQLDSANMNITPFRPVGQDPNFTINSYALQMSYGMRGGGLWGPDIGGTPFNNRTMSSGFGMDIGATIQLALFNEQVPAITASIALADMGVMTWNNGFLRSINNARDTLRSLQTIAQNDSYFDKFNNLKSEQDNLSFSTGLPTQLRIGGMIDLHGLGLLPLRGMFDYIQGFNSLGMNTTSPRIGIGVELANQGFIPALRTGMQIGGREGMTWTAGLGWNVPGVFAFDVGLWSVNALLSASARPTVGTGLRLKFGA